MHYQLGEKALVQPLRPRITRCFLEKVILHVTLVEVELVSGSYTLKQSGDIKTVEFNALKTAKDNGEVTEVSSASFMPQNVITLSGTNWKLMILPLITMERVVHRMLNYQLEKVILYYPSRMESWSLKKRPIILVKQVGNWLMEGLAINDVSTNYVFGASALTVI